MKETTTINIIGKWKQCPGISKNCENFVIGPYWVCLACWQMHLLAHGDLIAMSLRVTDELRSRG